MTAIKVLPADPKANYQAYQREIDHALHEVLESGYYLMGEQTKALEAEFASYVGTEHAIAVGSGTEAIHLALRACNIGPGDEVITVSHTAVATVAAIELAGAVPVFVDIEPGSFTIDSTRIESLINASTRAIIPVHLYGHPADMHPIRQIARRHGLRIIEDCAQSHGATLADRQTGSWGDLGAFSFYPTKNLAALGDAGMIVTNDAELAKQVQLLQQYGWEERYVSSIPGMNSRIDEVQAAILRVKLRHLNEDNKQRAAIAKRYSEGLADTKLICPTVAKHVKHVFHQYVIRSKQRDALREQLSNDGILTLIHYPVPIHLQPAYLGRIKSKESLRETEIAASEILSLPIYPELPHEAVDLVVGSIAKFSDDHPIPLN